MGEGARGGCTCRAGRTPAPDANVSQSLCKAAGAHWVLQIPDTRAPPHTPLPPPHACTPPASTPMRALTHTSHPPTPMHAHLYLPTRPCMHTHAHAHIIIHFPIPSRMLTSQIPLADPSPNEIAPQGRRDANRLICICKSILRPIRRHIPVQDPRPWAQPLDPLLPDTNQSEGWCHSAHYHMQSHILP